MAQFPAIAAEVWARRRGDAGATTKELTVRLEEQKKLKAELLRAKLRGEVSQADYAQANAGFDDEIEASPNNCTLCARSVKRLTHLSGSRS